MKKYKAIKIPESDYDEVQEALKALALKGTNCLPTELRPSDENAAELMTLGRIVGLGAKAIKYLLTLDGG